MEHVRIGKKITEKGTIAILIDHESKADWLKSEVHKLQYEGICLKATRHGYRTEVFPLVKKEMSAAKLHQMLSFRSIKGLIVAVPIAMDFYKKFPWYEYAAVRIHQIGSRDFDLDQILADYFYNATLAYSKLLERGYERIGLCLHQVTSPQWIGAYQYAQSKLPPAKQMEPFLGSQSVSEKKRFERWYLKWKPEVILTGGLEGWHWLDEIGVPASEREVATLTKLESSTFSGVHSNSATIGEVACEVVVNHLIHNAFGPRKGSQTILIKGQWAEGTSLQRIIS
jgi:hypothetical protein